MAVVGANVGSGVGVPVVGVLVGAGESESLQRMEGFRCTVQGAGETGMETLWSTPRVPVEYALSTPRACTPSGAAGRGCLGIGDGWRGSAAIPVIISVVSTNIRTLR